MNQGKTFVTALALALAAGVASVAQATDNDAVKAGIEKYRQMLQDGNPAELLVLKGEGLWKKRQGPKNASLEGCDLGKGPGVVKGAFAELPRYFADADRVMDLESRLVHCMVTLQGRDYGTVTKKPFAGRGKPQTEIENLVAYVVDASAGMPANVPQSHPKEIESYKRGEKTFFYRAGPYDFSCASCHGVDGQRIRLQDLPNLTKQGPVRAAFTTWPAYRVSLGQLRTMQWRMYDCFRQQRFPKLKYLSQTSVDLITYLGVGAKGGTMAAPGIKR